LRRRASAQRDRRQREPAQNRAVSHPRKQLLGILTTASAKIAAGEQNKVYRRSRDAKASRVLWKGDNFRDSALESCAQRRGSRGGDTNRGSKTSANIQTQNAGQGIRKTYWMTYATSLDGERPGKAQ
jgi:hypothetical protein